VQVAASLQNLPGPEILATYAATNAIVSPSLGRNLSGGASNVEVYLIAPRSQYGDRINQLDLRIGKILQFGGARLTPSVDIYNVFNTAAALVLNPTFGSSWQAPQEILNARFAKIGVRLDF
jgi:hypothetical protein